MRSARGCPQPRGRAVRNSRTPERPYAWNPGPPERRTLATPGTPERPARLAGPYGSWTWRWRWCWSASWSMRRMAGMRAKAATATAMAASGEVALTSQPEASDENRQGGQDHRERGAVDPAQQLLGVRE